MLYIRIYNNTVKKGIRVSIGNSCLHLHFCAVLGLKWPKSSEFKNYFETKHGKRGSWPVVHHETSYTSLQESSPILTLMSSASHVRVPLSHETCHRAINTSFPFMILSFAHVVLALPGMSPHSHL